MVFYSNTISDEHFSKYKFKKNYELVHIQTKQNKSETYSGPGHVVSGVRVTENDTRFFAAHEPNPISLQKKKHEPILIRLEATLTLFNP